MDGSLGTTRQFSPEFIAAFEKAFPRRTKDLAKLKEGYARDFVHEHLLPLMEKVRLEAIDPDHMVQMIDDGKSLELRAEGVALSDRKKVWEMWRNVRAYA